MHLSIVTLYTRLCIVRYFQSSDASSIGNLIRITDKKVGLQRISLIRQ